MKLEAQVISLELAKRLKELGVKQESLWWWKDTGAKYVLFSHIFKSKLPQDCSAFTVAELGELLPYKLIQGVIAESPRIYYLYASKCGTDWGCFYAMNNGQTRLWTKDAPTEADARAKMLIYLLEKGLIKTK